ncbi:TPA: DNA polymerase III subunit gamma/tau [Aeromonas veronii]|uniref:DNA polymerase III subunit gamma/tau n=2 Tax=Aeromonas veronii TaxID=654 RepID=UPI002714904F|nr:DNA polymerase III subunit gamma/tau [Aeromonas veronii]WLD18748.1 DNA polymerase III subunit gamma/tau [Aeromonas veronii]HDN9026155.1 DNA polymerase III subunit gamma/tau [Aeromonas veronii]
MSYQVLARKWRPHTFEQVVGQQHVLTALTNALDQGRLHHAYLLSGTRGVGKTTIARILAKSLNCEKGISSHPCGVCDTCREIDQGNFVDLLEIDAASRTKVEDTRELLDNVQYRPARGRFKVYLIDEVHMLSRHSFNALLKTLEEPPPYVKFLLATTDPQKLPITILSRCLQFHLKSLDQTQIAKQLEWVLDQEGQPFEPRALLALAKAADGSMRDALSLTDQALAHGNGSVRLDSVLAMLGTLDHRHLHQLLEAILRQDAPATMAKITEIATLGPDFDQLHAELEGLLHRIAMAQLLPASVQEQGADADSLLQLAKAMSPEEVQLCYQIVLGGRKDLPWAPDGRTALEMTCLRMLAFSPRRDALHPASLTALPPSMTSSAASSATPVASLPGKRPAAESAAVAPISGAVPAPLASPVASTPVATSAVPAVDVSLPSMTDDIGNPADSEEEAQAAELFSQQDELLREAAGMGYQPEPVLPRVQPDVSAHSAAQPVDADDRVPAAAYADHSRGESLTASIEPALEPTTTPVTPEAVSAVSSMQSLLGKRNMLRSRQRGQDAPAAPAPRAVPVAPARPVAPAAAPAVTQQPAPVGQPVGQGMAAMGHYDDLPPVDLYNDGYEPQGDNGEYEEYLNQGFAEQTPVMSHAPVTAPAQPTDLPPWDLDGQPSYRPGECSAGVPAVTPTPATQPPVASTAVAAAPVMQSEPAQPVMETIDWDELESDSEPQEGEATRLIPSSLLNGCGDPWAELIAHTQVGGRLRQLAINSVMTREGDKVLLTLKPEQRHLVSDKARADLAEIIGPALGQPVQVEVTLGVVPDKETPLEIEHRLYLGVREQVTRDLEQDPNVQFLVQRFGAVLHHESIEPLNR